MTGGVSRGADRPREWSRILRDPLLPGVEVLHAHFLRYRYAPHWHDAVCVALVGRGAAAFDCARRQYLAPAGSAFVIPAYEIHTGEPAAPDGLGYDVLYITPDRMAGLLEDASAPLGAPPIADVVHRQTAVAAPLAGFHRTMTEPAAPLQREHALLAGVVAVAREFSAASATLPAAAPPEHRAVQRAKDFLHANPIEPVTLRALAEVAGLSMYRLARTFRAEVGMPPYAYQLQLRVAAAKRLLAAGRPISRTALECGFYDQAHLTHQFKRYVGVTPGAYRRGC
ncbi:MAG TPA: AraC family transcriptional regulator [Actinomycetes bacterium]|nr:AraC family transcriptional regulator [Actinomycetes bacterium]